MQFVGLVVGIVLGLVLGAPLAVEIASLPALAGMAGVPGFIAGLSAIGVSAGFAAVLLFVSTAIFYVVASFGVPTLTPGAASPTDWREELGRGLLIGQNAALNFMLLSVLLVPGARLFAAFAFAMNALAVQRSVSNNPTFQVGLAYTGLFMPMTLPLNVLGFLIGVLNTALVVFGVQLSVFVDWTRAAVVSHGGIVHAMPTAYNLANFIQAHPAMRRAAPWIAPVIPFFPALGTQFLTVNGTVRHEASHTLSAAAFGWIFHIVGFIGEFVPAPNPDTYAELVAESGLRLSFRNWIDFWSPSIGAPPNVPPTVAAVVAVTTGVVDLGGGTVVAASRGTPIAMTAAGSADADAYPTPLGFLWRVIDPLGVRTTLGTGTTAAFVPALGGTFSVDTLVTDGAEGVGTAFGITAHVVGAKVADLPLIGGLSFVLRNSLVTIDGTASSVGSPAAVTAAFDWAIDPATIPAGASASVTPPPGAPTTIFVADTPGAYSVTLTLTGTMTNAAGATVTLTDTSTVRVVVA